jgi:hypothetical protein
VMVIWNRVGNYRVLLVGKNRRVSKPALLAGG